MCGHGQTAVVVADWMRAWTDYGHGCGLGTGNLRSRTGYGHKHGHPVEFPGRCREIARLLCGHCLGMNRTRPSCCADTARRLPGSCPAIARMFRRPSRRMLRGHCATIHRIFCEHRRLKNLRGEASTLKPAQNCVGTRVVMNLRNYRRHDDWHCSWRHIWHHGLHDGLQT